MKRGMGLVLGVAGVLVGGIALADDDGRWTAPSADASGVFHACVDHGGHMRLVGGPAECRRSDEGAIAWSLAGPAGPAGAIGPMGLAGAAGRWGRRGLRERAAQTERSVRRDPPAWLARLARQVSWARKV